MQMLQEVVASTTRMLYMLEALVQWEPQIKTMGSTCPNWGQMA